MLCIHEYATFILGTLTSELTRPPSPRSGEGELGCSESLARAPQIAFPKIALGTLRRKIF